MRLIGRDEERRELDGYMQSGKPEFLVVYGRRRVGKTFLIRECFKDELFFSHTGLANGNTAIQLAEFNKSLRRVRGEAHRNAADWLEAFDCLREHIEQSESGRKVLFIDELPWMDRQKSLLLPALEHFWNGWASGRDDIFLIVCGSATSWVITKLLHDKGGFYGRITGRLFIKPFMLKDCESYYREAGIVYSRYQMVESYMIFGGVPFYLSLMKKELGFPQNVDRLCFREGGALRSEYELLYRSLFKSPEGHISVIEALANKRAGLSRDAVLKGSRLSDGGGFTRILHELEQCGFIRRYVGFGKKKRDAIYQLIDPFTLFHLRFIKDGTISDAPFWSAYTDNGGHRAWTGYAFEQIVLTHVGQIKRKLQIGGVLTRQYSWRSAKSEPGVQIDLVIDRNDGVINLCEIKYCRDEYEIDAAYDKQLRRRVEVFRRETGTKSALHTTLITTYGLIRNKYAAQVQSVVTMEDLFADSSIL
ncbi:MAG: ATP-binding protein [Oscillospiraceae bacterium]|nr:ATP-binding protein [Oscillospiraceae bacterium]